MSSFDDWQILGIEPASDPALIREAYLNALPKYHPEDDPEGFMKLRAAYEAALASLKDNNASDDGGAGDDGHGTAGNDDAYGRAGRQPDGADTDEAIKKLLSDFQGRMDEAAWKKLFSEYCQSIDGQESFSEKLLIALMEGQYLPRRVWLLFDNEFSWNARARQLKEKFPAGYIEYVLNGMRYERAIRDEYFDFEKDAGEDFDGFIREYNTLLEVLRAGDLSKAEELIRANSGSLFEHPDYRLMVSRYHRAKEEYAEELAILYELTARWPADPYFRTALAETMIENDADEALKVFKGILETDPGHYGAKQGVARASLAAGFPEDAKADAYELLMQDPYDGAAMNVFGMANEALVPVFTDRLEKDPGDMEARYKLASCMFNLGRYDESLDLIADTEPDEANRAKHYELYSDLFVITIKEMTDEDREILLEYLKAWEEAESDRQRMRFLPEKYYRLGMDDVAYEKAEILLTEFPGNAELCRIRAQILRKRGNEHDAFAVISEGLDRNPGNAALLSLEALLFEGAGNLGAAVDSANASLGAFPFNAEMWELLARIYDHAEQYEEVKQTVKRAEDFGVKSNILSLMKANALLETEDPDDEAQGLFEDALENDPYDPFCLEKLCILYARNGQAADAAALAETYIEHHEVPFAYLLRGWLYANYPQTADRFSKARARSFFRKAIDMNDRYAPAWYQLGILAYDEGRMAEAAADFQLALDIDPNISDVHFYLAEAYNRTGDAKEALRVLEEGLLLAEGAKNEKGSARLLSKKADLLYEQHMYKELTMLGEKPADNEENPAVKFDRLMDLANSYYEISEDETAETLYKRLFEEIAGIPEADRGYLEGRLNARYAMFLRHSKYDIQSAIECYRKSMDKDETMRSAVWLAIAYKEAGEYREAANLFKKALKIKKKSSDACTDYLTGECFFGLGQLKKAKEFFGRAILNAPEHSGCPKRYCFEAEFSLGLIALEEGDKEAARAHYNKVLEVVRDRDYMEAAPLFE